MNAAPCFFWLRFLAPLMKVAHKHYILRGPEDDAKLGEQLVLGKRTIATTTTTYKCNATTATAGNSCRTPAQAKVEQ